MLFTLKNVLELTIICSKYVISEGEKANRMGASVVVLICPVFLLTFVTIFGKCTE